MKPLRSVMFIVIISSVGLALAAADAAWQWSGAIGSNDDDVIIGDIDIQRRADPTTAFAHIGETLKSADLVYANLEGMLVKRGVRKSTFRTSEAGAILAQRACVR